MKVMLASIVCQKAEIEPNLAAHKRIVLKAVEAECDLVVFPEMSLTGYLDPVEHSEFFVGLGSASVQELIAFGISNSIALLFGIVEGNADGAPFITQIHTSVEKIEGIYRKRHLADDETFFSPGVVSYQGKIAGTSFGVAVCADYEVADEFVAASEAGATVVFVVFHPSAPGLNGQRKFDDESWQAGFDWWRSSCIERHGQRAKELGISIAVCTQAGVTFDEDFPGWAALFGPDGEIVAELPDWREGTFIVEI